MMGLKLEATFLSLTLEPLRPQAAVAPSSPSPISAPGQAGSLRREDSEQTLLPQGGTRELSAASLEKRQRRKQERERKKRKRRELRAKEKAAAQAVRTEEAAAAPPEAVCAEPQEPALIFNKVSGAGSGPWPSPGWLCGCSS